MTRPFNPVRQPMFTAPPATLWLTAALVVLFVAFRLLPADWQAQVMLHGAFIPAVFWAELGGQETGLNGFLPLVSHMFLHHDVPHILMNAGLLLAFGSAVERGVGSARFLVHFVITGVAGAVTLAVMQGPELVRVYGASGAVFGSLGGALWLMYRSGVPALKRRALQIGAVMMALNLVFGLIDFGLVGPGVRIAWQAHLGGFVVGILLMPLLARRTAPPAT